VGGGPGGKSLEKDKWAKVTGWRDRRAALQEVRDAAAHYDRTNAKEFTNVPRLYNLGGRPAR